MANNLKLLRSRLENEQRRLVEEIEQLTGEQEMKIESKSNFNFSVGTLYEIIDRLDLKIEAFILPFEDNVGLGIALGAIYSF